MSIERMQAGATEGLPIDLTLNWIRLRREIDDITTTPSELILGVDDDTWRGIRERVADNNRLETQLSVAPIDQLDSGQAE